MKVSVVGCDAAAMTGNNKPQMLRRVVLCVALVISKPY
jgi:hypothetical protein